MSGHWPPDWEDQEEEFPEGADQLDADAEAQLSEVAAYLASVPVPVMPDSVETRISAALAAESATRAGHAGAPTDASRTLDRKKARARVRRNWGGGGPHRFRSLAGGSLVVCLLVGLGFALSYGGGSSSSSSEASSGGAPVSSSISAESNAGSGSSAKSAAAPRAAGSFAPAGRVTTAATPPRTKPVPTPSSSSASSSASSAPTASAPAPAPTSPAPSAAPSVSFAVTTSGTNYQKATLGSQVRARLNPPGLSGTSPSTALRGCVSQVTGGPSPQLVDRATYQGSPAYIIATSSRAWVVGVGCTATNTELITSVPLAGLPGNLRALVSVEQYRRTSSI